MAGVRQSYPSSSSVSLIRRESPDTAMSLSLAS
jgi:hypothetical protein